MPRKVLVATEKPFAKVAVTGIADIFRAAGYEMALLESYKDKADLLKAVAGIDGLIIRSDVAMNTPGQNSNAVAELVFGLMINLARRGFSGKDGTELRGKKIGIHAYGNVGKYVALIARGFGMELFAFDPYVPAEKMKAEGVTPVGSMDDLYSSCDYISLHLPKTKDTVKSIHFALLSKMKKGAAVINTARAEVIDEAGLLQMMEARPDFLYGADVAPECAAEFAAKYAGRYCFTAKKIGAQTAEANINAGLAAARQIVNFLEKGDKTFQVN
ncbi:MAG: NAD(P)-binding domain-containing protein [Acidobacteria bacterium]|nr:NAD(P)-binding domain-containing protein [Acidobacteriota bacterium]